MQRLEKLIFAQADRTPEAVAVEHNGSRLSYRELKAQALEISQILKDSGVLAGDTVALFQHRSLATLPLMVGIWDAGGVVVPINPATPPKMLEWMIQDAAPRLILNEPHLTARSNGHSSIYVDRSSARTHDPDDCYIIYTSGSEGRPKGVIGSHQSLIHYLHWQAKEFAVNESDRFSQTAPLSFDFSLKELLVPLLCGARVCIADRSTVIDARKFVQWVRDSEITVMCCVPTLLRSMLRLPGSRVDREGFRSLRAVLISGDMLRWEDVSGWRERFGTDIALFNLYGPTEVTVIKLFYRIPETRFAESINVPVGRPIPGSDVLIVNENNEPSAPGEIGEIVIVSEWLARGYVNDRQNDDGRFCILDFQGARRRAYRTGDLGRWLSDGNLELMGRKDRQVKVRGYRIELNEIESILSSHEAINDVAVIALNRSADIDADSMAVIACCFTSSQRAVTEKELRNFAKERLLPQVLSLTRFRRLDKLPLMANGKVDRLQLESLIDLDEEPATQASPAGLTVRERISAMWEELLALEGINVEANFFELGGDSMTAIRLLRRVREELHPELKLDDVYEFSSISQLSNRVEQLLAYTANDGGDTHESNGIYRGDQVRQQNIC
jgi:amino acid adenylation domain-containing protein